MKEPENLRGQFANPPMEFRPTSLYWLNDVIEDDVVKQHLLNLRDKDGFGSVAILPEVEYHEPGFMEKFGRLLDKVAELGMWAIFCDDKSFPSGTAGGEIPKLHPELCSREINMVEKDIFGHGTVTIPLPEGNLIGCVGMNSERHSLRFDLSKNIVDSELRWDYPFGNWKVMIFYTKLTKPSKPIIDYLNEEAVKKWIDLTYQRFYDALQKHFGATFKSSFYDDISLYQAKECRPPWLGDTHQCWTDSIDALFKKRYGYSPLLLYPALWHDIGDETAAARAMLFGLRAELLSEAFVKSVADWCAKHGIDASGHPAGDYELSPMAFSGDAIKFYKHAQRILVDVIIHYGRGRDGIKLATSAASLYDRKYVQCETFGVFENFDDAKFTPEVMRRTTMELFSRGVNQMITHATWYNPDKKRFVPEISWRNQRIAAYLPEYSKWVSRCQLMLQGGRHVVDIAVLYPIDAIMGDASFHDESTVSDYQEVGEMLTRRIRADFTFMHPEVLAGKCSSTKGELKLENTINHESYKVLIIPGKSRNGAIRISTLLKAKEHFDNGGVVICTSKLPERASQTGKDAVVRILVRHIFGLALGEVKNSNSQGGKAYFIPELDGLATALDDALPERDVRFENAPIHQDGEIGELSYIHKVRDGHDLYYFANSRDKAVEMQVKLRGRIEAELLDPSTGKTEKLAIENLAEERQPSTLLRLSLPANSAVFVLNADRQPQ